LFKIAHHEFLLTESKIIIVIKKTVFVLMGKNDATAQKFPGEIIEISGEKEEFPYLGGINR